MAVALSTTKFDNWARTGSRYDLRHLMQDGRLLMYMVEGTFAAGDVYVIGGVDVDLRRGSAREVVSVLFGQWNGAGASLHYDYANEHLLIVKDDGTELDANTVLGNDVFTALVFARE